MPLKIRFNIALYHILLLLALILFTYCSNPSKQSQQEEEFTKKNNLIKIDDNSIFDGKTLEGWKVTQFGTQGPVTVLDGKIKLGFGDGCTGITATRDVPTMNYEITLDAKRTSGNDFFCGLTFPVNDSFCSFIVGGWGGSVVGLSNINNESAAYNVTKTTKKFENNTWYTIKLRLTPDKIEAWIDNDKRVNYTYKDGELSIRNDVNLSKPLGICTWNTAAELRDIRLKKIKKES